MGTSLHQTDEFLEIRNMTGTAVDFTETSWSIYREGEFMIRIDEGILPAHGFFLICRRDSTISRIIGADMISGFLVLTNSNTGYAMYAGADSSAPLLDIADDGIGYPMSGRFVFADGVYWSMERNDPPGEGNDSTNWHVGCFSRGFEDGTIERGTPGYPNYENVPPNAADSVILTPAFVADDTIVQATAYGIVDPDTIPGEKIVIFDWLADDSLIYTEIDSYPPYISNCDSSKTRAGRFLRIRSYVFDGTDSSNVAFSDSVPVDFEKRDLIINEIAWMGSNRSDEDEFVELFNTYRDDIDFTQSPFYLTITGTTGIELTIDDGILLGDDYWLISHFEPPNPDCAFDVSADLHGFELNIPDSGFNIELRDFANYVIDEVWVMDSAFAGECIETDSVAYTMSRKSPPGDGSTADNWFTSEVTVGYKLNSLERGTPGSENIRNSPPLLEFPGDEGFIDDMFEPEIGNMDSFFWWRVKYIDADNEPADTIWMFFDYDCDDIWQADEVYPLFQQDFSDTDFTDGVIFRRWLYGLNPTETGSFFSIRAGDGHTISTYGIPAVRGPIVEPTIRFTIFGRGWEPEPIFGPPYSTPYAITEIDDMPILIHSGDAPLEVGLSITRADIYEHSSDTSSYSPGGWDFVEDLDSVGNNLYALSALFVPTLEPPSPADFNDDQEDLLIGETRWFNGDTLGRISDSLSSAIQPGDRLRLAFKLDLPHQIAGFYSRWEHRITVTLIIRTALP